MQPLTQSIQWLCPKRPVLFTPEKPDAPIGYEPGKNCPYANCQPGVLTLDRGEDQQGCRKDAYRDGTELASGHCERSKQVRFLPAEHGESDELQHDAAPREKDVQHDKTVEV